jgi:hypothetical protein
MNITIYLTEISAPTFPTSFDPKFSSKLVPKPESLAEFNEPEGTKK